MRENRGFFDLRPISFEANWHSTQDSLRCLSQAGNTLVLCSASFSDKVPPHAKQNGTGWLTAEYAMLPTSTHTRQNRESHTGKISGRSQEIQRLLGRALRAAVDLKKMQNICITIDCDVLKADGGTRMASLNGACVVLYGLLARLYQEGKLLENPWLHWVAGVSVGCAGSQIYVDMDYQEDKNCDMDLNLVMNEKGAMIEIQGSSEGEPVHLEQLDAMRLAGKIAIEDIIQKQKACLF